MPLFGALEIITDSIRYDKSFFRSNGFISHGEIFYAIVMLVIFAILMVRIFRAGGFKVGYVLLCRYLAAKNR